MVKKGNTKASVKSQSASKSSKAKSRPQKSPTTNKKSQKKPPSKKSVSASSATPAEKKRQLKQAPYKSFKLQKRVKSADKKLPNSFSIFTQAIRILLENWPLFLGIIAIYALLSIILAGALSIAGSSNLTQAREALQQNFGSLAIGFTLFALLLGNSTNSGGNAQLLVVIVISLAIIWGLRQSHKSGGRVPRVRDAFYQGMTPLVQFVLVLLVILLELIPMAIGAFLYATVINNNIAINLAEKSIFAVIFFLLSTASLHMLTSSAFAAYIVTLDGMTPIKALRSAVELVRFRRGRIFLKLLFIFVILAIISAIVIIPLAIWVTPLAPYVFLLLTFFFLAVFHSYIYALYRELL